MPEVDFFLWSKVKTGEKEAFQILFEKYYSLLCLISNRYTRDINKSKDIIQKLFIHLWEHKDEISITVSLKSYLHQAARFNSIRAMENDRKQGILLGDFASSETRAVMVDQIEFAELQETIIRTIDGLPEQCRKVFTMSRFEQLKHVEIAEKLEISIKTVESHITKALKILEDNLQKY